MRKFVAFALITILAFSLVSFAKNDVVDPSGKCDAMYYANMDVFGDIMSTYPSANPGPSNAWVGISYANDEVLQFKNVASPVGVTMDRINPNTGAIIGTVTLGLPTAGYIMEGTYDGTNIWVCQWNPAAGIHKLSMTGAYISSITPAITGSPRAIAYDGTDLWVGTNTGSNLTDLYQMTTGGTVLNHWVTNTVVGWYMGFDYLADAPDGGRLALVDNVGNTIKRLAISGPTVTIANQVPSPAGSPDVGEGLGYNGDHMITCGAYASAGLVWFLDDGYVPADPLAPAACTGFTANNNGPALQASLAWTLPTLTVNGTPLNPNQPITAVRVKRDGVVIANLAASATSYTDNVPAAGQYAYQVYAVNSYGNGLPANATAWIGLDVPAAPSGVTATVAALNVNVAWTAPSQGAHNGYWPPGSWTGQKVYRNGTLVATLTGSNTTYTDTPPVEGDYVYGVAYYNTSGTGPLGNAPSVHAGPIAYAASVIPFAWIEINPNNPGFQYTGTNTGLNSDDQNLGPFSLGFSYSFYGNSYSTFRVCSNGWASFTSTLTAYVNSAIPSTTAPFDLLGIYWDDMNMAAQGSCWYYYDATNQRCIIEWDNIAHYGTTPPGSYTMEIIINQTGIIDFQYKTLTAGLLNSSTIGIQNATGTTGLQCVFDGVGPINPVARSGIRFQQPGGTQTWDVNITPVSPPITIPANGGSFPYYLNVHNLGATPATLFLWNKIKDGAGIWTQVFGPLTRTLPGGANPTRTLNQNVAASVGAGTCYYVSYIGLTYGTIQDSSYFTFTKSAIADGGPWISESECFGDFLSEYATETAPSTYALSSAFPNPFNPTTNISYTLVNAGVVKLSVFDVTGREVATLVNGFRDAGSHNVTFDGASLASGVYIYRLTAGDFNATGKMVLMK